MAKTSLTSRRGEPADEWSGAADLLPRGAAGGLLLPRGRHPTLQGQVDGLVLPGAGRVMVKSWLADGRVIAWFWLVNGRIFHLSFYPRLIQSVVDKFMLSLPGFRTLMWAMNCSPGTQ